MITPDGRSTTLGTGGAWCVAYAEFDKVGDRLILDRCDRSLAIVVGTEVIELAHGYARNRIGVSKDGTLSRARWGSHGARVGRGHRQTAPRPPWPHRSRDGRRVLSRRDELASSSYDKTIRIWQLGTQRSRVLRGHAGAVDRVVWRDGAHLVTAGAMHAADLGRAVDGAADRGRS